MPATRLKQLLESHDVPYETIPHPIAYTAQEVAASAHVRGREMAKTVIVKIDGKLAMAVLPAARKVDLERLKEVTGAEVVEIATENEFRHVFPECEVGAMPPFGGLYRMNVYVDKQLQDDREIVFNAGAHNEVVRLAFRDYERLEHPRVLPLSRVR